MVGNAVCLVYKSACLSCNQSFSYLHLCVVADSQEPRATVKVLGSCSVLTADDDVSALTPSQHPVRNIEKVLELWVLQKSIGWWNTRGKKREPCFRNAEGGSIDKCLQAEILI